MFTDAEIERYQRHIILKELGGHGQRAFAAARVAVVGVGGLGCPALEYLAAAGVGHLTIIDDDRVELSNLQRQTLFATADVGRPKVAAAAGRLHALNPHVQVVAHTVRLDAGNADTLLAGHDVIADGCDSFRTRAIVNRAAVRLGIPLVSAALGPFEGQVGVFAGHLPDAPCYACFAGTPADVPGTSCSDTGILGAVAGITGAAQAVEVLRLIAGFGTSQLGHLWIIDALGGRSRRLRVPKDPGCPVCSSS